MLRAPRHERLLVGALALFAVVWMVAWDASSGFTGDDNLNFAQAQERHLDWAFLKLNIYQHFSPGHRILNWIVVQAGDPSWALALGIMAFFFAVTVVLLYVVLRELLGPSWLILAVTALFVISPVWVRVGQWFANGALVLPAMAFGLLAVWAALRWRTARSPRLLALVLVAFTISLLFYSLSALVLAYIAGLAYLVQTRADVRGTLRAIWADKWLWIGLGVIMIAYLLYLRSGPYYKGTPRPTGDQWSAYLRAQWLRGVAPLALGSRIPVTTRPLDEILVVLSQLAVFGTLAWTILRAKVTWRPWLFALGIIAVASVVIGAGRVAQFGLEPAYDPRYHTEVLLVLVIGVAVALAWALREGRPVRPLPVPAMAIAAPVLILLALLSYRGDRKVHDETGGAPLDAFVAQFRKSTDELKASGRPFSILDRPMPEILVPSFNQPYNRMAVVARVFGVEAPFMKARGTAMIADPNGNVRPVHTGIRKVLDVRQLAARGGWEQQPDAQGCFGPGPGGPTVQLVPRVQDPVPDGPRVLDLQGTFSGTPGPVGVYVGTLGGLPGAPTWTLSGDQLDGGVRVPMEAGQNGMHLELPPGGRLCVKRLVLTQYA